MPDKITKAELADAVRDLRAEVARLSLALAVHHCHACAPVVSFQVPSPPYPVIADPFQVTCAQPLNIVTTTPLTAAAAPATLTTWTMN